VGDFRTFVNLRALQIKALVPALRPVFVTASVGWGTFSLLRAVGANFREVGYNCDLADERPCRQPVPKRTRIVQSCLRQLPAKIRDFHIDASNCQWRNRSIGILLRFYSHSKEALRARDDRPRAYCSQ
jgi:hypothetical protein